MIRFKQALQHITAADFVAVLKTELEQLDRQQLPLQAGLVLSSYVSDSPISITILSHEVLDTFIRVKAGIFYTGIIAGCNCADDPSPVDEINEYCEIQVLIDMHSAEVSISLL